MRKHYVLRSVGVESMNRLKEIVLKIIELHCFHLTPLSRAIITDFLLGKLKSSPNVLTMFIYQSVTPENLFIPLLSKHYF